jgi:hypothetical protein
MARPALGLGHCECSDVVFRLPPQRDGGTPRQCAGALLAGLVAGRPAHYHATSQNLPGGGAPRRGGFGMFLALSAGGIAHQHGGCRQRPFLPDSYIVYVDYLLNTSKKSK